LIFCPLEKISIHLSHIKLSFPHFEFLCIFDSVSAKEMLLEVAESLRPEATLAEAIRELEFRNAVQEGLESLDRGERVPLDEARKLLPKWVSKYSSPARP
jgi:predicted transcriptional regulator